MISYVIKKHRGRDKYGRVIKDRMYTGYYRLAWMPRIVSVPLHVTELQTARKKLADIIRDEERREYGAVSRDVVDASIILIKEHVGDFVRMLASIGRTKKHCSHVNRFVMKICESCSWIFPRDICANGFEKWRIASPLSGKTKNHYLSGIHEFCAWMVRNDRMLKNPFDNIEKIDLRRVVKTKRRALTPEQVQKLLNVLPFRYKCIVLVAVYTGLRRNEISSLKWEDIRLDGDDPVIIAPASITKNAEKAVLCLRPELVCALREYRRFSRGELVFGGFSKFCKLKKYWIQSGIPVDEVQGYDFHSLRVTYGTMLAANGGAPRVVQAAMRHSDSRLTERVYTDTSAFNIRREVYALPSFDIMGGSGAEIGADETIFCACDGSSSVTSNVKRVTFNKSEIELKKGNMSFINVEKVVEPAGIEPAS